MNLDAGMDIAQIRNLARQMDQRANEIEGLLSQLTTQMRELPWAGDDRNRFVDDWEGRHAAGLRRVAEGLKHAAKDARDHARNQEWASRAR